MSVLRGAARRLALGLALAAAFALVPAQPAAADLAGTSAQAGDLWQAALEWLAALWGPVAPETDPPAGGGASATGVCGGDQGMCIDPNG